MILAGWCVANTTSSSSNAYWYCWNSGSTNPHHAGRPVAGDHLCSQEELRAAGKQVGTPAAWDMPTLVGRAGLRRTRARDHDRRKRRSF